MIMVYLQNYEKNIIKYPLLMHIEGRRVILCEKIKLNNLIQNIPSHRSLSVLYTTL